MPINVKITEPQPHTMPSQRIHTGRGGAGNAYRSSPSTSSSNTVTKVVSAPLGYVQTNMSTMSSMSNKFSAGRGGAGNIHPVSDAMPYNFEDELTSLSKREEYDSHNAYHVGRGGAGNWAKEAQSGGRKMSEESTSSLGSERGIGFMRRLSNQLTR